MITLVYSNLSEQSCFLGYFFDNFYYDYSANWYSNVGYLIVYTMVINMVMPLIKAFMVIVKKKYTTLKDSNFTGDNYVTRC